REKLITALAKPLPEDGIINEEVFNPWEDIITGIDGSYANESDDLMISALEAVQHKTTFEFINEQGFVAECPLYVLSGHGLTEYGTSPRSAWPNPEIADLWPQLIDKWKGYKNLEDF